MRILKHLGILLAGLCVVLLAFSLLMPGRVMTSRWVYSASDTAAILEELRDLEGWKRWNLLLDGAKDLRVTPTSSPFDAGGRIGWKDAIGRTNGITVTQNSGNGIVTELRFGGERPVESGFSVEKRRPDSVQVVWYVVENLRWYPWEKFYGMMASDLKGPLMQESLHRLKAAAGRRRTETPSSRQP
jgi:hypothetical protein